MNKNEKKAATITAGIIILIPVYVIAMWYLDAAVTNDYYRGLFFCLSMIFGVISYWVVGLVRDLIVLLYITVLEHLEGSR